MSKSVTGSGHSYRELEDEAKLIKNEILKVKDVAKVIIHNRGTGAEGKYPFGPICLKSCVSASANLRNG